jgi:hypothetical protein
MNETDDTKKAAPKGDGLHHHELHEDEGGGYHSKHTHPDGRVEHGDHATYDDAKADQDEKFGGKSDDGQDDGDYDGADGMDDNDADDIAGSYGRRANCG